MDNVSGINKCIDHTLIANFCLTLDSAQKKSIFDAFFDSDTYDEEGNEVFDDKLTGKEIKNFYTAIGENLKTKFLDWCKRKTTAEDIYDACLINYDVTSYDKKSYDKAIKSINTANIEDIFFKFSKSKTGGYIYRNILMPSYENDMGEKIRPRTPEEIKKDIEHIRNVLKKRCKELGIDTRELDKLKIEIESMIDENDVVPKYLKLIEEYRKSESFKTIINTDNRERLQSAIDEKYDNAGVNRKEFHGVPESSFFQMALDLDLDYKEYSSLSYAKALAYKQDVGNGKFDKPAMQHTGNCWLLAGINSLAATEEGRIFLEKNIVKDNDKHLFAVHIQAAENKHLPKPKGDGIYVFSELEVQNAQNSDNGLVSGDGDIAAYALAIEEFLKADSYGYLQEGRDKFSASGELEKLFEIITGQEVKSLYSTTDENSFDNVMNAAGRKNTAIVLGNTNHAFSVVGVDNGTILVQESNLSTSYKDVFELVENSFPPTYRITKEAWENEICQYSILSW